MEQNNQKTAAGASVDDAAHVGLLDDLLARTAPCFARRETRLTCRDMVNGMLTELDDHNCWTMAEAAGHPGPHKMQHLLSRARVDDRRMALSSAINDPTTAVQVLNHLSDVLRLIGMTDFSGSRRRAADAIRTGLVIPARSWEDYLTLAVTEIREYGSTDIQVMRRMRAMLEELRDEVRPEHRPGSRRNSPAWT